MDIRQKDKKYLGREGSARPLLITQTEGSYAYDDKGKKYITLEQGLDIFEQSL